MPLGIAGIASNKRMCRCFLPLVQLIAWFPAGSQYAGRPAVQPHCSATTSVVPARRYRQSSTISPALLYVFTLRSRLLRISELAATPFSFSIF